MKRTICLISVSLLLISGCDKSVGPGDNNGAPLWAELKGVPWPKAHHDPQFTGNSPYAGPTQGIVEWSVETDGQVWGLALGADGTIYFGTDRFGVLDAALTAVSSSGVTLWKQYFPGFVRAAPLVTNSGEIFVLVNNTISDSASVANYSTSQVLRWHKKLPRYVRDFSSVVPSSDGTLLYCVTIDRATPTSNEFVAHLLALSRSGSVTTLFTTGGDTILTGDPPSISRDGGTLYVPGKKGIYAVSTNGTLRWRYGSHSPASTPSIDSDGNLYFVSDGIVSLTKSGVVRWKHGTAMIGEESLYSSVTADGTLFIVPYGYATGSLVILSTNGLLIREIVPPHLIMSSPITDKNGVVYFCTMTNPLQGDSTNVWGYDKSGALKFRASVRYPDGRIPDISASPVIGPDGAMYIAGEHPSGGLFKIR